MKAADMTERARALVDTAMSEAENLARDVGRYDGIPHFVIAYGRLRTVIEGAVNAAHQQAMEVPFTKALVAEAREAAAAEARREMLSELAPQIILCLEACRNIIGGPERTYGATADLAEELLGKLRRIVDG